MVVALDKFSCCVQVLLMIRGSRASLLLSRQPMAKTSRDKPCRWRIQWSAVTLCLIVLVVYNAVANMWLLRPPACPRSTHPSTEPPSPATCEPCEASVQTAIDDDPIIRLDLRLGRWDGSRNYRLYDYAALGSDYAGLSGARKVCLATQSSIERLHELLRIAAHWSGPISVAVFVAGDELRLLRAFVVRLMRCEPLIFARMALHVVVAAERTPVAYPMPAWAKECSSEGVPIKERRADTATWRARHPYPQNHLRNLARRNCQSSHVFLVDIDIVPSKGMAESLEEFLSKEPPCHHCAYVVPTYELDYRVTNFPENKTDLLRLSKKKLAIPFHRKVFIYNQYASNFSRWEATRGNESSSTHVSHNVTNFELLYEPFYVATDTVPAHDERFLGYGFTRNTQVYEMFVIGYQFRVLSPIFTIHWGIQQRRSRPLWREKQNEKNRKHFEAFKRELFARYRKDPLNLLRRPPDKNKKT